MFCTMVWDLMSYSNMLRDFVLSVMTWEFTVWDLASVILVLWLYLSICWLWSLSVLWLYWLIAWLLSLSVLWLFWLTAWLRSHKKKPWPSSASNLRLGKYALALLLEMPHFSGSYRSSKDFNHLSKGIEVLNVFRCCICCILVSVNTVFKQSTFKFNIMCISIIADKLKLFIRTHYWRHPDFLSTNAQYFSFFIWVILNGYLKENN